MWTSQPEPCWEFVRLERRSIISRVAGLIQRVGSNSRGSCIRCAGWGFIFEEMGEWAYHLIYQPPGYLAGSKDELALGADECKRQNANAGAFYYFISRARQQQPG